MNSLSVEEWEDILPGYSTYYPVGFCIAIPYLLTSLVYHKKWLRCKLPLRHPLQQRVWNSYLMDRLKSMVLTGVFRNETSRMMATGIPPYVVLSHRMHEFEAGVRSKIRGFHDEIKRIPEAVTTCTQSVRSQRGHPLNRTANEWNCVLTSL